MAVARRMTLGQTQELFARLECQLRMRVLLAGYDVRLGHIFRSRAEAIKFGKENSVHRKKLAVDYNLFLNGVWQKSTADHRPFGEWWEQQHPLCRWGGRWGDGNHYSLEYRGVK